MADHCGDTGVRWVRYDLSHLSSPRSKHSSYACYTSLPCLPCSFVKLRLCGAPEDKHPYLVGSELWGMLWSWKEIGDGDSVRRLLNRSNMFIFARSWNWGLPSPPPPPLYFNKFEKKLFFRNFSGTNFLTVYLQLLFCLIRSNLKTDIRY